MWSLICLFGNRLLFCFMARSTLSFRRSARFIFGPVLCPFLRALRNLCQQRRCSFVSVGSEIIAQWLTGWRVAAGPCIADLTNAVQTRPGILYAVCVSVTDSLHVTVWPLSSDPRSRHVTIHLPLWHEWLSSTTDPLLHRRGPRGCRSGPGPRVSLEQKKFTHAHISQIYHMSLLSLEALFFAYSSQTCMSF